MLLHEIKPAVPVHGSRDAGSFLQGPVQNVGDDTAPDPDIQDFCPSQLSEVRFLSSLFREKSGPVQDREKRAFLFLWYTLCVS